MSDAIPMSTNPNIRIGSVSPVPVDHPIPAFGGRGTVRATGGAPTLPPDDGLVTDVATGTTGSSAGADAGVAGTGAGVAGPEPLEELFAAPSMEAATVAATVGTAVAGEAVAVEVGADTELPAGAGAVFVGVGVLDVAAGGIDVGVDGTGVFVAGADVEVG